MNPVQRAKGRDLLFARNVKVLVKLNSFKGAAQPRVHLTVFGADLGGHLAEKVVLCGLVSPGPVAGGRNRQAFAQLEKS